MLRTFLLACFIVTAVPLTPAAYSQSHADAKIGAIHFKGLKRFTAAQLMPIVKIPVGSNFDPYRLEVATHDLGATGAFEEVRYGYRPENGAVTVDFIVKEAAQFRRCTFDNFPFATTDEINAYIRGKVPLYDGSAPDGGSMLDDIGAALQSFAASRGITSTVDHISYQRLGSPDLEYVFRVSGPTIKIASVHFTGTQSVPESDLINEAKPLAGRDYSLVSCREFARTVFAPFYRERGFLQVKIADAIAKLPDAKPSADSYDVQVEYPVTEGLLYRWDGTLWQGNQSLTTDQLSSLVELKSGDVANSKKIDSSWEAISKEYSRHGYIRAQLRPSPIFDDAARKVQYQVTVAEGQQFHMGTFTAQGFPPGIAEKLQSRWKLKPGEIYDATYLNDFFKKELGPALSNSGLKNPKINSNTTPNTAQLSVDVLLLLQ